MARKRTRDREQKMKSGKKKKRKRERERCQSGKRPNLLGMWWPARVVKMGVVDIGYGCTEKEGDGIEGEEDLSQHFGSWWQKKCDNNVDGCRKLNRSMAQC
jgi:hypothetical protein